jgi:hypothetical protein
MSFFINPVVATEFVTEEFNLKYNLFPSNLIEKLPMLKEKGIFLCGGAALALYLGNSYDSINDFDFYAKNVIAQKWFDSWIQSHLKMKSHFVTDNAITYINSTQQYEQTPSGKVQLIIRQHFFNYYEIFNTFDFSVCKVGYDGKEFYFGPNTLQHILEKKLVLEGKPTADFVKRWFKYSLRGYKMPNDIAAQIIKGLHEVEFDARHEAGY